MAIKYTKPNTNTTSVSWTATANWEGGSAPGNGDEAHLRDCALRFDLTLDHSGIQLAKLVTYDTFTGSLGGSGTNRLKLGFDVGLFHVAAVTGSKGTGSPLINLDHGAAAADITCYGSRTPPGTDRGLMPTRFVGAATSGTVLNVIAGHVSYGGNSIAETGACPTVNVAGPQARVIVGAGITLTTVTVSGGEIELNSACPVLGLSAGTVRTRGDWQMGTATLSGGTAVFNHRKTGATEVQDLRLHGAGARLDLSQVGAAFAATATTIRSGGIQQFSPTQFSAGTVTLDFNGNRSFTGSLSA